MLEITTGEAMPTGSDPPPDHKIVGEYLFWQALRAIVLTIGLLIIGVVVHKLGLK